MSTSTQQTLKLLSEAADSISIGDILDASQRSENSWSLLPIHAVMSTVRPCFFTHGGMQGMYNFPGWLGQNSKQNKSNRLLREIQQKMKLRAHADKSEIRLQYLPTLSKLLTKPLVDREAEGIEEVIQRMDHYYLNREDWDSIMDLGYQDFVKPIAPKNKTAFTRMYPSADIVTIREAIQVHLLRLLQRLEKPLLPSPLRCQTAKMFLWKTMLHWKRKKKKKKKLKLPSRKGKKILQRKSQLLSLHRRKGGEKRRNKHPCTHFIAIPTGVS
jgi:hypothetical protein